MTSLRGLLALDSKSQNEELPYSHVFKGAPSRYMTGNFCHDPLIINIKIDTKDEVQNYVRLLPDYCCPHRAGVACWKSYSCQNPSLLALDEEKWAARPAICICIAISSGFDLLKKSPLCSAQARQTDAQRFEGFVG